MDMHSTLSSSHSNLRQKSLASGSDTSTTAAPVTPPRAQRSTAQHTAAAAAASVGPLCVCKNEPAVQGRLLADVLRNLRQGLASGCKQTQAVAVGHLAHMVRGDSPAAAEARAAAELNLDLLVQVLNGSDEVAQAAAAEVVRSLAMHHAKVTKDVRAMPGCLAALVSLLMYTSDSDVSETVGAALWSLACANDDNKDALSAVPGLLAALGDMHRAAVTKQPLHMHRLHCFI